MNRRHCAAEHPDPNQTPAGTCTSCDLWRKSKRFRDYCEAPTLVVLTGGPPKGLPGTKLKEMLQSMGFKTCGTCAEWADRMDAWGPDGCVEHREEIVNRLREAWSGVTMQEWMVFIWRATTRKLSFIPSLTDPVGSLVDEAIRRSKL